MSASPEGYGGLQYPGIRDATISVILAELDFKKFESVREVVAFMGLAPKDKISGTSVKGKPRLCKTGNARLRKCFYMPAMVAIRFNPVVSSFHRRLNVMLNTHPI